MESALVRHADTLFGEQVTHVARARGGDGPVAAVTGGAATDDPAAGAAEPEALSQTPLHMTAQQQRRLWRHVRGIDSFWETLDECEPGIVARLASLAAAGRWEVIFLTKRPASAGDTSQLQSQRWLAAKGFALPSVFVVQGSRGLIAASLALDVVVDDRPENCLDVAVDSTARPILVWRRDAASIPPAARQLGIAVVSTVGECLDSLSDLHRHADRPSGVIDRLRGLFGRQAARA